MSHLHARETRAFACEVKFLVEPAAGAALRAWMRAHLDPDPHGTGPAGDEYRTTSIYFDTADGDVYHRRGSFGRSKYRVRRYGASGTVFLERKLRRPGILAKRRTLVPLAALDRLQADVVDPDWAGAWFHRRLRLRAIAPVCQVSYARTARVAATIDGPARLTLDEDVRVLPVSEPGFRAADGLPIAEPRLILEMKYRRHLPAVFKRLLETFSPAPHPASKYRLGIAALTDPAFPVAAQAAGPDARHV